MSNASLKEQLQSLGLSTPGRDKSPQPNKKPVYQGKNAKAAATKPARQPRETRQMQPKPAWLEQAQYGVELLKAHFPKCFKDIKELQPLKIGIKQDLVKHLSTREDIVTSDKACMVNSLSYYVNSPAYHKKVVEGISRIDLEGNSVGAVTADEAKYSIDCRNAKLQKKQNQLRKKNPTSTEPHAKLSATTQAKLKGSEQTDGSKAIEMVLQPEVVQNTEITK